VQANDFPAHCRLHVSKKTAFKNVIFPSIRLPTAQSGTLEGDIEVRKFFIAAHVMHRRRISLSAPGTDDVPVRVSRTRRKCSIQDCADWIADQDDDREMGKIEAQIGQSIPVLSLKNG
jgi:hypothetical protein